ncbi:DUF5750 family protein [Methanobrevibacter sp.]|uniref:DUF5750 family protein n=1 Tax=Methanobrevibacter sp. TaxID=66852 RepID=UPI00388F0D9C
MIVEISDYGQIDGKNFIDYKVLGLSDDQLRYLELNLDEKMLIDGNTLKITMYFDDNLYPFQSDVAKIRMEDFIAREEIEMNVFLSSFLEDM